MLKVELACQEFRREDGHEGRTAWPIPITDDQLTQLMRIPGVFTPNTRSVDQLEGVAIWSIKSVLLLGTILRSWEKKHPWVKAIVEILHAEDPKLKKDWNLRMIYIEDATEEIMLTQVVGEVNFLLLPGTVPDREKHRRFLRGNILKGRKRRPFDFNDEEVNLLVSNLGEENQLWY